MRIRVTWEKRYRKERFVNTKKLRGKYDNPLSPEEMKKKIEEHCSGAKDLLMNVKYEKSNTVHTGSSIQNSFQIESINSCSTSKKLQF